MEKGFTAGVAGFLGLQLCERSMKKGFYSIGKDSPITRDLEKKQQFFKLENIEFYNSDVTKFVQVLRDLDYFLLLALATRDPLQGNLDIAKTNKILGWDAMVPERTGMKIAFDCFNSFSTKEKIKQKHKDFSKYIN